MKNAPKNIATLKVIDDYTVIVEVIHTNEKSYSRSVEPSGNKLFMSWRRAGNGSEGRWYWTHVFSEKIDENISKAILTYERRAN
jgi:hypothetical protein